VGFRGNEVIARGTPTVSPARGPERCPNTTRKLPEDYLESYPENTHTRARARAFPRHCDAFGTH
jgi:hypothetical protein